jgi:hypothetical protein
MSYLFYNQVFFLILLWTVYRKEAYEPAQMVSLLLYKSAQQNVT